MITAEPIKQKTGSLDAFRAGKPGIYSGVSFEHYLQLHIMSQSTLKAGRDSMLHLKYAIDHLADDDQPTDAMTLGSALHVAFLEPALMLTKVANWTGPRRAGNEWLAFKAENRDKAILTPNMFSKLQGMITALRKKAEIRSWISKVEEVEVSAVGVVGDILFKGRADALTDDPLCDLKMISKGDDRTIAKRIYDFGYHIQAHIYKTLFGRERFCFAFVEEEPPHDVRPIELSESWLKLGKTETNSLIQRYNHSARLNNWPGRSEKCEVVEPPNYLMENSGVAGSITIGGESAFGSEE